MVWNYRAKKHSVCHTNFQSQKLFLAFGVGGGCGPLPWSDGDVTPRPTECPWFPQAPRPPCPTLSDTQTEICHPSSVRMTALDTSVRHEPCGRRDLLSRRTAPGTHQAHLPPEKAGREPDRRRGRSDAFGGLRSPLAGRRTPSCVCPPAGGRWAGLAGRWPGFTLLCSAGDGRQATGDRTGLRAPSLTLLVPPLCSAGFLLRPAWQRRETSASS